MIEHGLAELEKKATEYKDGDRVDKKNLRERASVLLSIALILEAASEGAIEEEVVAATEAVQVIAGEKQSNVPLTGTIGKLRRQKEKKEAEKSTSESDAELSLYERFQSVDQSLAQEAARQQAMLLPVFFELYLRDPDNPSKLLFNYQDIVKNVDPAALQQLQNRFQDNLNALLHQPNDTLFALLQDKDMSAFRYQLLKKMLKRVSADGSFVESLQKSIASCEGNLSEEQAKNFRRAVDANSKKLGQVFAFSQKNISLASESDEQEAARLKELNSNFNAILKSSPEDLSKVLTAAGITDRQAQHGIEQFLNTFLSGGISAESIRSMSNDAFIQKLHTSFGIEVTPEQSSQLKQIFAAYIHIQAEQISLSTGKPAISNFAAHNQVDTSPLTEAEWDQQVAYGQMLEQVGINAHDAAIVLNMSQVELEALRVEEEYKQRLLAFHSQQLQALTEALQQQGQDASLASYQIPALVRNGGVFENGRYINQVVDNDVIESPLRSGLHTQPHGAFRRASDFTARQVGNISTSILLGTLSQAIPGGAVIAPVVSAIIPKELKKNLGYLTMVGGAMALVGQLLAAMGPIGLAILGGGFAGFALSQLGGFSPIIGTAVGGGLGGAGYAGAKALGAGGAGTAGAATATPFGGAVTQPLATPVSPVATTPTFATNITSLVQSVVNSPVFQGFAGLTGITAFTVATTTTAAFLPFNPQGLGQEQGEFSKYVEMKKTVTPQTMENGQVADLKYTITIKPKEKYQITITEVKDEISYLGGDALKLQNPAIAPENFGANPILPGTQGKFEYTIPQVSGKDVLVSNTVTIKFKTTDAGKEVNDDLRAIASVTIGHPKTDCLVFAGPEDSKTGWFPNDTDPLRAKIIHWTDEEKARVLEAFNRRAVKSTMYTTLACQGGDIRLFRIGANPGWGAWTSGNTIGFYPPGVSTLQSTEYTLVHELGHIIDHHTNYHSDFGKINKGGCYTYAAIRSCFDEDTHAFRSGEAFAEAIALYIVHTTYPFRIHTEDWTQFPSNHPDEYKWLKDNIFGGVEFHDTSP